MWPVTGEQATHVSGTKGGPKMFINFCPETAYDRFGWFAANLYHYTDEIDSDAAHARLGREGTQGEEWRWTWEGIHPMHYTECPLYSLLLHPQTSPTSPGDLSLRAVAARKRTNAMSTVFISYSHSDSETADIIVSVLEEIGVAYFRDVKDIQWGEAITSSVREGLDNSAAVIVIISPGSLKSHWVSYEVGYATASKKRVLPYLTHLALDPPGFIADLSYVKTPAEIRGFFQSNPDWAASSVPEAETADTSFEAAFTKVAELMPDLLRDMQKDLSGNNHLIREFVPLKARAMFNHGKPRFAYRDDVHPHLFNKVDMLEASGFVSVCHEEKDSKIYKMSEPFVERLLAWDIPRAT